MLYCFPDRAGCGLLQYAPTVQAPGFPARLDGIEAQMYLHYATQDFSDDSERGRVNAIGNCKRAIHLAVDNALAAYGLLAQNRDLHFPQKLELLDAPSLLPISVLRRLNVDRNTVEHEYKAPDAQAAAEAIDIARLLLLAIDGLRQTVIYEVTATTTLEDCPHAVIRLLPTSGTLNYHELHAPEEFFATINGVRCFSCLLRNHRGLVEGVTVRSNPTHSVPLTLAEMPRWAPVLADLAETSRNSIAGKRRIFENSMSIHVTVPIEGAEAEALSMIFDQLDVGSRRFDSIETALSIPLIDPSD